MIDMGPKPWSIETMDSNDDDPLRRTGITELGRFTNQTHWNFLCVFPTVVPSFFCDTSILFNSHRFPAMAGLCLDLSTYPGLSEVKTVEFHIFKSFKRVRISNERNDAPLMFEIAGNLHAALKHQDSKWPGWVFKDACFQPILRQPPKPTHGSGQFHDFANLRFDSSVFTQALWANPSNKQAVDPLRAV